MTKRTSRNNASKEAGTDEMQIELHLKDALDGLQTVRRELANLRRDNERLRSEIELINVSGSHRVPPKNSGKDTSEIRKLKAEISRLKKDHLKDRRRIRKFEKLELERDIEELQSSEVHDATDDHTVVKQLDKILKRLHELFTLPSFEPGEECVICMEKIQAHKASSLPCEHVYCDECLARLQNKTCPVCRKPFEDERVQRIVHTASQQWDSLVNVVEEWINMNLQLSDDEQSDLSDGEQEEQESNGSLEDNMHTNSIESESPLTPTSSHASLPLTPPPTLPRTSRTVKRRVPDSDEEDSWDEKPLDSPLYTKRLRRDTRTLTRV